MILGGGLTVGVVGAGVCAALFIACGAAIAGGGAAASEGLMDDPEAPAVAGEDGDAAEDEVTSRLRAHADKAVSDYANKTIQMSPKQAAASDENPNLEPPFRGQVIDSAAKAAVLKDPLLPNIYVTRSGEMGPDFYDLDQHRWFDITTPESWDDHLDKYGPVFGPGTPLYTK